MRNIVVPTAITVIVLICFGWTQQPAPQRASGRFQIIAQPGTNEVLGNIFLLDTSDGKVWRQIDLQGPDGDDNGLAGAPRLWVPMTRLDSEKDLSAFSARHPGKTKFIKAGD